LSTNPRHDRISAASCCCAPSHTACRKSRSIAQDDTGIHRIGDLVGKSVAVNRSGLGEFLLVAALEKHKVDRAKVKFVYLNPPDAALASGKVDAWSMWSPSVDIARLEYKAHDIFLEGRDLDFQIDFSAFVVTRGFADANPELVRAANAAYQAEAAWVSQNTREAELIAQRRAGYSDEIRDQFIARKRQYHMFPVTDAEFVAGLQKAADWLTTRKSAPRKRHCRRSSRAALRSTMSGRGRYLTDCDRLLGRQTEN
ncbi:MAG TPA: NrtA/SsuA/CpmA family ABC transporter substrate-binding protein, partial [Rhizomicrobium sp.]